MCGICGEVDLAGAPDAEGVRRASRAIAHRGPDAEGFHFDGPAALGHRRLSILDLESGGQPMVRDGVALAFNGEAYDFAELREQLRAKGHPFTTRSDTEVVLRAYLEWGEEFAERVHGMFALALWDARRRKLVLARDRLGKKPLYYFAKGSRVVFGSELKALLAHGGVPRALDPEALVQYLACEYVPAPATILRGVNKLPAAHVAVLDERGFRLRRYWDVPAPEPQRRVSSGEAAGELLRLLDVAVEKRLVADVPVGVFLSGGIDSTSIAALAIRHKKPLQTFSIGFLEESFDESPWAQLAAERLGTEHVSQKFSGQDCLDLIPAAAAQLDEPFADPSFLPTLLLSRFTRRHVKVALAGDGGDELFAGYDKYVVEGRERMREQIPRALRKAAGAVGAMMPLGMTGRRFLRHLALEGPDRYFDASTMFHADEMRRLFRSEALVQIARHDPWSAARAEWREPGGDWLAAAQYDDINRYLPLDILAKVDRMTMAHSIEARPPLLDHKFVEFAATIPARLKMQGHDTKYIFKKAMRGILPDSIIDRQKHGFAVPLAHWFRGALAGFARDILLSDTCRDRGILDTRSVERLFQLHNRGRDLDLQLWTMLSFELWCRRFLDTTDVRDVAPERTRQTLRRPAPPAIVAPAVHAPGF